MAAGMGRFTGVEIGGAGEEDSFTTEVTRDLEDCVAEGSVATGEETL
jgi:hypothetical protein